MAKWIVIDHFLKRHRKKRNTTKRYNKRELM